MNCGCVTRGNPFDMNEQIMGPCVLHLVWLDIKTKEMKLQVGEQQKLIEKLKTVNHRQAEDLSELSAKHLGATYAGFTAEEWFGKHGQMNNDRLDLIDKLNEANRLVGELQKAAKTGAEWMRWWLRNMECDCEAGHVCGKSERWRELEGIDEVLSKTERPVCQSRIPFGAEMRMIPCNHPLPCPEHTEKRLAPVPNDKSGGDVARCGKCGKFYVDHADDDCHG